MSPQSPILTLLAFSKLKNCSLFLLNGDFSGAFLCSPFFFASVEHYLKLMHSMSFSEMACYSLSRDVKTLIVEMLQAAKAASSHAD